MTREARQRWEARAASLVGRTLRLLPRRTALRAGRSLGRLLSDLDPKHTRLALENLRRALPHWDEIRLRRTARAVYAHFGEVLFDILWMHGRARQELLPIVEFRGFEHVEAARAAKRGILFVTAHFGNWEFHALAHSLVREPIGVVARPLDNPELDRSLCDFRAETGNVVIYKRRALQQVMRMLREDRAVALLIDQNVQEDDGIFVDFFGRPAATTTVAAAVALKTGCALVPVHCELRPDGTYRASYEPAVALAPSGDRRQDIARLTQQLTTRIESWVRGRPEQWLWIHRRWKTQPPAATS